MKDKKKIAAGTLSCELLAFRGNRFCTGEAAFKLMCVDLLEFDEPTEHIASRPDNIVQVHCWIEARWPILILFLVL